MAKYKISDFSVGDTVYHLSSPNLTMVVISICEKPEEVSCRWIDAKGISHTKEFLPQELGKTSDFDFSF